MNFVQQSMLKSQYRSVLDEAVGVAISEDILSRTVQNEHILNLIYMIVFLNVIFLAMPTF